MGLLVIGMNFIDNVWVAAPFLILLGALGGYLVVPMNALLQHRGHNLMGAGRSIAVQNFNEQACILGLGAFYTAMTKFGLSAFGAITIFGLVVAGTMELIRRWHRATLRQHRDEVERLLAIARIGSALSAPARPSAWPALALVFNAFVWGVSWWPLRQLEAAGLHPLWATRLIYVLAVVAITLWRARRLARAAAPPGAVGAGAGLGHHQRHLQLGA